MDTRNKGGEQLQEATAAYSGIELRYDLTIPTFTNTMKDVVDSRSDASESECDDDPESDELSKRNENETAPLPMSIVKQEDEASESEKVTDETNEAEEKDIVYTISDEDSLQSMHIKSRSLTPPLPTSETAELKEITGQRVDEVINLDDDSHENGENGLNEKQQHHEHSIKNTNQTDVSLENFEIDDSGSDCEIRRRRSETREQSNSNSYIDSRRRKSDAEEESNESDSSDTRSRSSDVSCESNDSRESESRPQENEEEEERNDGAECKTSPQKCDVRKESTDSCISEKSNVKARKGDLDEDNNGNCGAIKEERRTALRGSSASEMLNTNAVGHQDFTLENNIKRRLFKTWPHSAAVDPDTPKVNGDHKLFKETEPAIDTVIDVQADGNPNNHLESIHFDAALSDSDTEGNLRIEEEIPPPIQVEGSLVKKLLVAAVQPDDNAPRSHALTAKKYIDKISFLTTSIDQHDDDSRFSSLTSTASQSTATTSSNGLVIDSAIEDFDQMPTWKSEGVKNKTKKKTPEGIERNRKRPSGEVTQKPRRKKMKISLEDVKNSVSLQYGAKIYATDQQNTIMHEEPKVDDDPFFTRLLKRQLEKQSVPPPPPTLPAAAQPTVLLPSTSASVSTAQHSSPPALVQLPPVGHSLMLTDEVPPTPAAHQTSSDSLVTLTEEHMRDSLSNLETTNAEVINETPPETPAADAAESTMVKLRFYKCVQCATLHSDSNIILHMREKHNRYMCMYCFHPFTTLEKLSLHLEIKHDIEQNHFNSEEAHLESGGQVLTLMMCCICHRVWPDNESFSEHQCAEFMKPCTLCGQKGRHTNQCPVSLEAKHSSKVKKKAKEKAEPAMMPRLPPPQQPTIVAPPCNTSSLAITPALPIALQSEESNGSMNMVIDESCTINHASSISNPFRELDERERMDEQTTAQSELGLPPEEAAFTDASNTSTHKLVVPKLKLRVPREFQKSVDAALSSTESECEDDVVEENEADIENGVGGGTVVADDGDNSATESATEATLSQEDVDKSKKNLTPHADEDSLDESNTNLARILQEIERTKKDIQLTKQTLHANKKQQKSTAIVSIKENPDWTPTPPTSPNVLEQKTTEMTTIDDANTELLQNQDSLGSADMDVDETITGQQQPLSREAADMNNASEAPEAQLNAATENWLNLSHDGDDSAQGKQHMHRDDGTEQPGVAADQHSVACEVAQIVSPPSDGIEVADEDTVAVDLQLDRPLEKYEAVELVRICLKAVYPLCLYCNHARRIAVNGKSLVLHMIAQHRFSATVDSITAEELKPETIVAKLKSFVPELESDYFNSTNYCTVGDGAFVQSFNERIYECFQCRFVAVTHKELYLHNRKMHLRTAILCFMCRSNFFNFSEILCHLCPGVPNKVSVFDVTYRCCLCDMDNIPSPFRLMVHLRKTHFSCDVCLEDCRDQSKLSSHVWKHKQHHLCYRCGIAYRNKLDIMKHLYWKHGTESAQCKRCLEKRWRHVYHFCVPPTGFVCDVCQLGFSKAMYLKVHKRIHSGDLRYPCTDEHCEEKFISRRLLLKHTEIHSKEVQECKQASDTQKKHETGESQEKTTGKEQPIECASKENDYEKTSSERGVETVQLQTPISEEAKSSKPVGFEIKTPSKRKKKDKRSKESLEDLNLIVPNLSESDSSDESEGEYRTKNDNDALLPKVMLSPDSETDNEQVDKEVGAASEPAETGKVLEIWENFLKAQQASGTLNTDSQPAETDFTEDNLPNPAALHVVFSDHDYCRLFRPPEPPAPPVLEAVEHSPSKTKSVKSPKIKSSAHRSGSSSSSSDSSSSSNSSCSCGSNCSCSSSDSSSSSSSSSSNGSNTSAASNSSRKRHRKKSDRDRLSKKSASLSPLKKHCISENVNVEDLEPNIVGDQQSTVIPASSPPREPLFYESDLETAESDTDEEFYDEHPQKLASEMLAQKRAQLMARTFLSPSHNFDIVENSRPSTPSLPEGVACEKKVKSKKKKRERKSSRNHFGKTPRPADSHPIAHAHTVGNAHLPAAMQMTGVGMAESPMVRPPIAPPAYLTAPQHGVSHLFSRVSEGSSCSDADASLKRSKRERRPNKFYGYTSDDESMANVLGQPLMIGMRAFKPQPPPQLTWHKEDLPTPSRKKHKAPRSTKTAVMPGLFPKMITTTPTQRRKRAAGSTGGPSRKRTAKKSKLGTPAVPSLPVSFLPPVAPVTPVPVPENKLPPIPPLKIRSSQIGIVTATGLSNANHIPPLQLYSSSKESDEEDDSSSNTSSDEEQLPRDPPAAITANVRKTQLQVPPAQVGPLPNRSALAARAAAILPSAPPPPPVPQTTVFNHRIPPALLPNPDFHVLQYFKANNIRYPIRPPEGARKARDGESVYCYCRCPYDEVSEMIACDGASCLIEWFHFECVGIMVAPQGKWYCPECRPQYAQDLYMRTSDLGDEI